MKVKFASHSLAAGKRGMTIIDMIHKGESERSENGENFQLKYGPEGKVKIFITRTSESGRGGTWAWFSAQIKQKSVKPQIDAAMGVRL